MTKKIKFITNTVNKKIVRIEEGEYLDGSKKEIDSHLSSAEWQLTREIHVGEWRFHEFARVGGESDQAFGGNAPSGVIPRSDRSDKFVSVSGNNSVLPEGLPKI